MLLTLCTDVQDLKHVGGYIPSYEFGVWQQALPYSLEVAVVVVAMFGAAWLLVSVQVLGMQFI